MPTAIELNLNIGEYADVFVFEPIYVNKKPMITCVGFTTVKITDMNSKTTTFEYVDDLLLKGKKYEVDTLTFNEFYTPIKNLKSIY